jgi:spore germination protein KC
VVHEETAEVPFRKRCQAEIYKEHQMKTAKRFCIFLLTLNMVFLSGCWNYHELEDMLLVTGVAIDKGKNGYSYHLTFEFMDLITDSINTKLIESDGNTIYDCIRNVNGKSEKKLNFSECKIIVISQDLAQQGIAPLLDWFARDHEPRINVNLLVSKEKTANEIFHIKPITDEMVSLEIWKSLNRNIMTLGKSPAVELYQAVNMLSDDGISLILPSVKIDWSSPSGILTLDGASLFRADKLFGYLNNDETQYLLFLKNQIHGGILLVGLDSGKTSLEIIDNQTKITPKIDNNEPSLDIEVKIRLLLAEDQTAIDHDTSMGIKKVQIAVEKMLCSRLTDLIASVQNQADTDIFGFGLHFYRNYPDYWKQEKTKWSNHFKKMKCTVTAIVKIENTERTKEKIKVGV